MFVSLCHLRVNNKERSYCFCSKMLSFFLFLLSCHLLVSLDLPNIMIIIFQFVMTLEWQRYWSNEINVYLSEYNR